MVLALLIVTVAGCNTPADEIQRQGEKASISVRYLDELEENLRRLREDVPKFIESAEAIAKSYVEDDKYILGAGGDPGARARSPISSSIKRIGALSFETLSIWTLISEIISSDLTNIS